MTVVLKKYNRISRKCPFVSKDELKRNAEQKKYALMMRRIDQKERSQNTLWTGNFLEVIILLTSRKGKENNSNFYFSYKIFIPI